MKYDAGWLISVFGLGIALLALWMASHVRGLWARDVAGLRNALATCEKGRETEILEMRQCLSALETGMATAQDALREGRLNRSVRAQALQMLRGGATAETVAGRCGMAVSEARLLTRVGEILSVGGKLRDQSKAKLR